MTYDKCGLHLQEHPMLDKLLHLDCFQSHGKHDLVETVMDSLVVPLFASLFQLIGQIIFSASWLFPISVAVRSSLLDDVLWN